MNGGAITLRDGACVTIRQIRSEDADLLRAGFERLSEYSRYRRFLSATPRLRDPLVRYLTQVNHKDHEALIALAADGAVVGVARYVRWPDNREAAEVAVTVADDWQGRGLGTALLALLVDRARAEGIDRFTALMLASNREMLKLLEDLGPVRTLNRSAGTAEVELALPRHGVGTHLSELLRGSASGRYRPSPIAPILASGSEK